MQQSSNRLFPLLRSAFNRLLPAARNTTSVTTTPHLAKVIPVIRSTAGGAWDTPRLADRRRDEQKRSPSGKTMYTVQHLRRFVLIAIDPNRVVSTDAHTDTSTQVQTNISHADIGYYNMSKLLENSLN